MSGFVQVAPGVYYLAPPVPEFGGGVTLIKDANNYLIDCGAFDYSVSKFIVPALKAVHVDVKNVNYLLFTHCHPENIGGVHKLKQLDPDLNVFTYGYQADRLKNPSYYFMQTWTKFLDHSPPFRELKGFLANGNADINSVTFDNLRPMIARGHDADCVCWYHTKTETLICGDAIQGGGCAETGVAFITSLNYYKNTISDLIDLAPQNIICSKDMLGVPAVITGRDNCQKALEKCLSYVDEYLVFVDKYSRLTSKKKENLEPEELAYAYFESCEPPRKPARYGYAMHTFSEFIKRKR